MLHEPFPIPLVQMPECPLSLQLPFLSEKMLGNQITVLHKAMQEARSLCLYFPIETKNHKYSAFWEHCYCMDLTTEENISNAQTVHFFTL